MALFKSVFSGIANIRAERRAAREAEAKKFSEQWEARKAEARTKGEAYARRIVDRGPGYLFEHSEAITAEFFRHGPHFRTAFFDTIEQYICTEKSGPAAQQRQAA